MKIVEYVCSFATKLLVGSELQSCHPELGSGSREGRNTSWIPDQVRHDNI